VPEVLIGAEEWASPTADLLAFDRRVHAAEDLHDGPVVVRVEEGAASSAQCAIALRQILTRYQRLRPTRNLGSQTALFDRVLVMHRALHDVGKPLVRADYDHACDTWQWVLRLEPAAGVAVQVAALFHDIERLKSEPVVRIEQHAADYQRFKDAHALRGAALTREVLSDAGLEKPVVAYAVDLVARHERPQEDPDLLLLNDADALSFFALNSWGFVAHFGAEHSRKKVAYTLGRMRPSARERLSDLRHPPLIAGWLSRAG
jgi:hypothetical protein